MDDTLYKRLKHIKYTYCANCFAELALTGHWVAVFLELIFQASAETPLGGNKRTGDWSSVELATHFPQASFPFTKNVFFNSNTNKELPK